MSLVIQSFVKPPLKNNNYVIADEVTRKAVLIDCSHPDEEIMQWTENNNFDLQYILLTHGHFDHLLGVKYYTDHYGLTAYLYQEDRSLLARFNEYPEMLGLAEVPMPTVQFFSLKDSFTLGACPIKILPTPGHTQGSVCYLMDGNLFSGDTLFHGTYGRTDLLESDDEKMHQTLKMLFNTLPDNTPVYPGHGIQTTIGLEREQFLNHDS